MRRAVLNDTEHHLANVDHARRTADCSACGPTLLSGAGRDAHCYLSVRQHNYRNVGGTIPRLKYPGQLVHLLELQGGWEAWLHPGTQSGCCAWPVGQGETCSNSLIFLAGQAKSSTMDHSAEDGLVRGWLCAPHNRNVAPAFDYIRAKNEPVHLELIDNYLRNGYINDFKWETKLPALERRGIPVGPESARDDFSPTVDVPDTLPIEFLPYDTSVFT